MRSSTLLEICRRVARAKDRSLDGALALRTRFAHLRLPVVFADSDSVKPDGGPGVWFCSSLSTHLPPHRHPGTEFNLLLSGRLLYRVEENSFIVRAGDLLVLPSEKEHHLVEATPDAAFWVLEFTKRAGPSWWSSEAVLSTNSEFRRAFLRSLHKLWGRPKAEQANEEAQRAESLLEHRPSSDGALEPDSLELHPAVVRARTICETHSLDGLDVSRIAKLAGISASRLAHLFQEQLGLSPLQYLNFVKVQKFVGEYIPSEPNLMRSALLKGFGSYPQFHRTFLQVCGNPPGAHFRWLARDDRVSASRSLGNTSEFPPPLHGDEAPSALD